MRLIYVLFLNAILEAIVQAARVSMVYAPWKPTNWSSLSLLLFFAVEDAVFAATVLAKAGNRHRSLWPAKILTILIFKITHREQSTISLLANEVIFKGSYIFLRYFRMKSIIILESSKN